MFQSTLFILSNSPLCVFSFVALFPLNWCTIPKDPALFNALAKDGGVGSISQDSSIVQSIAIAFNVDVLFLVLFDHFSKTQLIFQI